MQERVITSILKFGLEMQGITSTQILFHQTQSYLFGRVNNSRSSRGHLRPPSTLPC